MRFFVLQKQNYVLIMQGNEKVWNEIRIKELFLGEKIIQLRILDYIIDGKRHFPPRFHPVRCSEEGANTEFYKYQKLSQQQR